MYFIVYFDIHRCHTLVIDGPKGLQSMMRILENAKINFKPYHDQSYLSKQAMGSVNYDYWLEETATFS